MANRHLLRSIVLQTLFEWDFLQKPEADLAAVEQRNLQEFAPETADDGYVEKTIKGVIAKREDLDNIIAKAAPDWPLEKIAIIDRNVLRLGLYELLFADRGEVPAKVAINEAIELAKTYSGPNAGKFVNGVLGAVYKEMGEPGKDEVSTKQKFKNKKVPVEQLPVQNLGGAVVYARHDGDIYLALVHDIFGHWTLSKGKIPAEVEVKEGTATKVKEEIGIDIRVQEELGQNEYVASSPELGRVRKQVHYFLAEADFQDLIFQKTGGLDDAQWFKAVQILDLNLYDDIVPIFTKAINILMKA